MTDEEWEQVRPLVSKTIDAYMALPSHAGLGSTVSFEVNRATIEWSISIERKRQAFAKAKRDLEDKCYDIFGVRVSV